MLTRIVVKNFLSIGEELDFNLLPYPKIKRHNNHIYELGSIDVLKATAIYGANGAGKSNLVKAAELLHDIATYREMTISKLSNIAFKLNQNAESVPTTLEIEFQKNATLFSYGVDILDGGIIEEWLVEIFPKENRETCLFRRYINEEGDITIDASPQWVQTEKDRVLLEVYQEEVLDETQSLLSLLGKGGKYPQLKEAYDWFIDDLYIIFPHSKYVGLIGRILEDENFRSLTNEIISKLDTGVDAVKVEEVPVGIFFGHDDEAILKDLTRELDETPQVLFGLDDGMFLLERGEDGSIFVKKIMTEHRAQDGSRYQFELNDESDGTIRLFDLIPLLESTLSGDKTIIIDEIGRSLHPSLLKEFMHLFLSRETSGQMIFTTHESHLLDLNLFRQDEIWFAEKDQGGNTKMYPLSDFKPRYDLNIRKGYLQGRFGAIPFLADLSQLSFTESDAKEE
ncbi:MAG: ATP-binding protein [Bacteroidota bacterium]